MPPLSLRLRPPPVYAARVVGSAVLAKMIRRRKPAHEPATALPPPAVVAPVHESTLLVPSCPPDPFVFSSLRFHIRIRKCIVSQSESLSLFCAPGFSTFAPLSAVRLMTILCLVVLCLILPVFSLTVFGVRNRHSLFRVLCWFLHGWKTPQSASQSATVFGGRVVLPD